MTPIDRVRARDEAFRVLGLAASATAEELQSAWRRIAFERHPDRNGGDDGSFMEARRAYDLICGEGTPEAFAHAAASRAAYAGRPRTRARRTILSSRTEALSEETMASCQALLGDGAAVAAGDHVPHAVQRSGRSLTFLVATDLAEGINRIALPAALLRDTRRTGPKLLRIRSSRSGAADFELPEATRARMIPEARSVTIRFGAG